MEQLSPEVIRAQRQAELADLAKFRARHMQAYKDWTDPVKRAALIVKTEAESEKAREEIRARTYEENVAEYSKIAVRTDKPTFSFTLINKPKPKPLTRFQRMKRWISTTILRR